jgi:hypothetical protein
MRPQSVGELLDAAFAAVRRNFGSLVLCTLVVVVPVAILNTLIAGLTRERAFDFTAPATVTQDEIGPLLAGSVAAQVLSAVAQTLATAACLRTLGGDLVNAPAAARESLGFAVSRIGPLLWVAALFACALLVGLLMFLVGAIWLGVLFCLATPAVLFEDARGAEAMRRSWQLVTGHWWHVFAVQLLAFLFGLVVAFVLDALVAGVFLADSDAELANAVFVTFASIAAYAVALPVAAALLTYVYFDLRVRKEGFDHELLAARMRPPMGGFLPPKAPGT